MLAAIRADSVNLPLLLHVLGAMLLVGSLLAVGFATVLSRRSPDNAPGLARFGLKTLLLGVLPSYILMLVGAAVDRGRAGLPGRVRPGLDRDRLHHRRRRRAADPDLVHPRRDRASPLTERRRPGVSASRESSA